MKLFVDDIREAPDNTWTVIRNFEDAVDFIELHKDQIDVISLDHDLGFEHYANNYKDEKTGYDILLHIVQMKYDNKPIPKSFKVHSANPVGVERMIGVIARYLTL